MDDIFSSRPCIALTCVCLAAGSMLSYVGVGFDHPRAKRESQQQQKQPQQQKQQNQQQQKQQQQKQQLKQHRQHRRQQPTIGPPKCDGVVSRREYSLALGAVMQSTRRRHASTQISDCVNLAPAGTGTRTLYKRLQQYSPRRAHHSHWRTAAFLHTYKRHVVAAPRCFIVTLRDPAERWKTAWSFLEQQSGVYLPYGQHQQAPLKVLMRHFRSFTPNDFVGAFPLAPGHHDHAEEGEEEEEEEAAAAASGARGRGPPPRSRRDAMARRLYYASNSDFDLLRFHAHGRHEPSAAARANRSGASGGANSSTSGGADSSMGGTSSSTSVGASSSTFSASSASSSASSSVSSETSDPSELAVHDPRGDPRRAAAAARATALPPRVSPPHHLVPHNPAVSRAPPRTLPPRTLPPRTLPPRTLPPHNASLVWPSGFSWERKREPFLISVIHYLTFLASRPELELHVICTASFEADWQRLLRRFRLGGNITPGGEKLLRSDSSREGASSKARAVAQRLNSSGFFSPVAQQYVRECLYREDWALHRLLCAQQRHSVSPRV